MLRVEVPQYIVSSRRHSSALELLEGCSLLGLASVLAMPHCRLRIVLECRLSPALLPATALLAESLSPHCLSPLPQGT